MCVYAIFQEVGATYISLVFCVKIYERINKQLFLTFDQLYENQPVVSLVPLRLVNVPTFCKFRTWTET